MRGTLDQRHHRNGRLGIIPAYAGNTIIRFRIYGSHWDHPRVCGEHNPTIMSAIGSMGSSPRMRGTLAIVFDYDGYVGIIPAYAGNTSRLQAYSTRSRDHPRVCGEHDSRHHLYKVAAGSSPRMRGTQTIRFLWCHRGRIIPAYAGNTSLVTQPPFSFRDHPRVCGEHGRRVGGQDGFRGSSPRMRGTPWQAV